MSVTDFMNALEHRVDDILSSCTRCGQCVEVCPMPEPAGIDIGDSGAIAGGVLDILRGRSAPDLSERWALSCSNSGHCIAACEDGVNPRFMLLMARSAIHRRKGDQTARQKGAGKFQEMSRGERVLSRLQLPPDVLAKVRPGHGEARETAAKPDIIFYTGCNIIKTPHIALLCLDVLETLGVRYKIMGGPSHCCGIIQLRAGDVANAGRMGTRTIDKFADTGIGEVVSWCPTCNIQMGEFLLPTLESAGEERPFETAMFAVFLARHLDRLKAHMVHPVRKRVALHEHTGTPGVNEAVRQLLTAIPGLEIVELDEPPVGYMCNGLAGVKGYKKEVHRRQLDAAAAAGVTTFAGIYHACHRDLCGYEKDRPFEVVNFMELIGAALGLCRADVFKRLKMLNDADLAVAETADLIDAYGLDPDDVRAILIENAVAAPPAPLS